jgi:hypothetical protein
MKEDCVRGSSGEQPWALIQKGPSEEVTLSCGLNFRKKLVLKDLKNCSRQREQPVQRHRGREQRSTQDACLRPREKSSGIGGSEEAGGWGPEVTCSDLTLNEMEKHWRLKGREWHDLCFKKIVVVTLRRMLCKQEPGHRTRAISLGRSQQWPEGGGQWVNGVGWRLGQQDSDGWKVQDWGEL